MSERHAKLLVADMIESSHKILQYTEEMSYYDFIKNQLIRDGVMMNFAIIGEAATRLPNEIKDKYLGIEWH